MGKEKRKSEKIEKKIKNGEENQSSSIPQILMHKFLQTI